MGKLNLEKGVVPQERYYVGLDILGESRCRTLFDPLDPPTSPIMLRMPPCGRVQIRFVDEAGRAFRFQGSVHGFRVDEERIAVTLDFVQAGHELKFTARTHDGLMVSAPVTVAPLRPNETRVVFAVMGAVEPPPAWPIRGRIVGPAGISGSLRQLSFHGADGSERVDSCRVEGDRFSLRAYRLGEASTRFEGEVRAMLLDQRNGRTTDVHAEGRVSFTIPEQDAELDLGACRGLMVSVSGYELFACKAPVSAS